MTDVSWLPLRVLHVIASVDRSSGGPVEGLFQSVRFRSSRGQNIEVLTLDSPDAVCLASFSGLAHGVGPVNRRYGYTPKISSWIVKNSDRFDVVVIHGLWNHASIGGWQGCRKAGLPYVVFTHGMMDPWFRKAYPMKHWIKQLFWLIQGRVVRDASEVLFTSEEEKKLAKGAFWGYRYRPKVVAYAAADGSPPTTLNKADFESAVPDLGGRPYLLFLSRIHEKKGCDLLIEGFSKAVRSSELQLVIAGPGHHGLVTRLQELAKRLGIAERIHWAGMLTGSAKSGAFRGAEAFVLVSHQENFGIAVAEALAYGKPVLISDQVNIWREIVAGGGGLVVPATVAGATQVITLWEALSSDAKKSMGSSAREIYEANFTVESGASDLTQALVRAVQMQVGLVDRVRSVGD